ncbi:PP2C family protein-serine/threonine phosphatase [Nocardioides sp. MAHUQ-72]|uniref:PP2C family protein-serine/threonine phosphatase n=1 Tax=unclassified Nocardioides TaxID=2615069 RepID=UPI00360B6C04
MTTSVRERHARLLAESRSAEPRARLAQASTRAEFLLRLSRTVSAIQNPQRALETLVAVLLEEMVDVAQVVVRTGQWQLVAGAVQDGPLRSRSSRLVDGTPVDLDNALRRGLRDDVVVPAGGPARREALAAFLPDPDLLAEVDALGTEQLAVLPLAARGRSFGVLVIGRAPGFGFGDAQNFLDDLAARVAVGLDATLVVAESRYVASVLRRSLAPAEMPRVPGLQLATYYRVAHQSQELGGDFLDVHGPDDDLILLCGDVAGKGVEAAVHAKRIRNAVRTASHVDRAPSWILGLTNRVLVAEAEEFSEGMATGVCARLRPCDGHLRVDLANAGHPPALVVRADGTLEEVTADGVALALLDGAVYGETQVQLGPLDTLLVHTDGVTEARGADDLFGDHRLRAALRDLGGLPPSALIESVAVAVSDHLGERAHDDIALLAAQFSPDSP